jgi:hypothetical protein
MNSTNDPNSHEPLIDRALIGLDLAAEHHLAHCSCCQGEREKTEQALRRYAEKQREEASRPESFWDEQAARIRGARVSLRRQPPVVAVLASAATLLLVLGVALAPQRRIQTPQKSAALQNISDHDLLLAVERAVDNGTPYALEPVALMVDEPESTGSLQKKNMSRQKTKKELNSYAK